MTGFNRSWRFGGLLLAGFCWLITAALLSCMAATMVTWIAAGAGLVEHGSSIQDMAFGLLWACFWAASALAIGYQCGKVPPSNLSEGQAEALKRFARLAIVWTWIDCGVDARAELRKLAKESGLVRELDRGADGEPVKHEGMVKWLM